jgi:abequosyltransferase
MNNPLLSICINTLNRVDQLNLMIESILSQISSNVEIVIVDGGSNDNTPSLMENYSNKYPIIKYINSKKHIGIDEGYHMAVKHASGNYCWCLPDDDILTKDAIIKVLSSIKDEPELLIVNLQCYSKNLEINLNQRLFELYEDKTFTLDEFDHFFARYLSGLSYIGSCVIIRDIWIENDVSKYYGTYFGHYGVIASSVKIKKVNFLSDPIILYRSANSSWTPRSFEIWYIKWPDLVTSFNLFSNTHKNNILFNRPWRRFLTLIKTRAMGEYDINSYKDYVIGEESFSIKCKAIFAAILPIMPLNIFLLVFCLTFRRKKLYTIHNLMHSSPNPAFSKRVIKIFKVNV